MFKVPEPSELSDFNLEDFVVQPMEKDKRGYLYILYNTKYPEYIKVGRTRNVKKRLDAYNSDAPFATAKMLYISCLFENAMEVEKKVLQFMYDNTPPTTLTKEWFPIEYKQKLINIITKAEKLEEKKKNKCKCKCRCKSCLECSNKKKS